MTEFGINPTDNWFSKLLRARAGFVVARARRTLENNFTVAVQRNGVASTYAAAQNRVALAVGNFPRARRGNCEQLCVFWCVEDFDSAQIGESKAKRVRNCRVLLLKLN